MFLIVNPWKSVLGRMMKEVYAKSTQGLRNEVFFMGGFYKPK